MTQARDEIFALFLSAWNRDTPAVNGGFPVTLLWPGVDRGAPPDADAPFGRASVFHNVSRQASFAEGSAKRYSRAGVVTVQVFTPLSESAVSTCEKLGIISRNAFEGKATPGGVWFRNANLREIGSDGTWYQFNMSVEFNYDEFK